MLRQLRAMWNGPSLSLVRQQRTRGAQTESPETLECRALLAPAIPNYAGAWTTEAQGIGEGTLNVSQDGKKISGTGTQDTSFGMVNFNFSGKVKPKTGAVKGKFTGALMGQTVKGGFNFNLVDGNDSSFVGTLSASAAGQTLSGVYTGNKNA